MSDASYRPRAVLVTGVSRFLGARVASDLAADPRIERVVGVDTVPPQQSLGRTEFVRADLLTGAVAGAIEDAGIDTVVHLNMVLNASAGRTSMKEINVIGTMQLLAACQRSATVRKVVIRSSAAVYGASPRDPAVWTEDDEPRESPVAGFAKDATEIEAYTRGLARRRADQIVSVLRFVNFLGPGVDSPLTRYLTRPVVPTPLGYDPRLQFMHVDDGAQALRHFVRNHHPGTFNVAADGVLLLSQAVRRAGRVAMPVPKQIMPFLGDMGGQRGSSTELIRLLQYGRVLDTTKLTTQVGWRPRRTTAETFSAFLTERGRGSDLATEVIDAIADGLSPAGRAEYLIR